MKYYELGWIAIRALKLGRAWPLLKRDGWRRLHHAELNNRLGADFLLPGRTRKEFRTIDWSELAGRGLHGIAFWITDAQWEQTAAETDLQWRERAIIDFYFNQKHPTGKVPK